MKIRCPRLGGEVPFAYCEQEAGDLPCPRMILCWQPYTPVEPYLRSKLSTEQWDQWRHQRHIGKTETIVELIETAKDLGPAQY